jgi:hypothetical protein
MTEIVVLGNNTQLVIDKGGAIWLFGFQMSGATVRLLARMREGNIANINWIVSRICSMLCRCGLGEWLMANKDQTQKLITEAMQRIDKD